MNQGLRKTMPDDLTLPINLHQAGKSKPVLTRVQGTDTIGKLWRQHGNYPVGQIYAGSALISLPVQDASFRHIMADIRDMNAQMPDSVLQRKTDGIIQISGVLAVNRYRRKTPKILSPFLFLFGNFLGNSAGIIQNLQGKGL